MSLAIPRTSHHPNSHLQILGDESTAINSGSRSDQAAKSATPQISGESSTPTISEIVDLIKSCGDCLTTRNLAYHAIESKDIDSNSITGRTIKDRTILSRHLARSLTIQHLTVDHELTVQRIYGVANANIKTATLGNVTILTAAITTANVTTLDLGANTIANGVMAGDWDFGSGNLSSTGTITAGNFIGSLTGPYTPTGDLDMNSHLITNIGNVDTNFTASGGLALADSLTVSSGGASITGNSDMEGTLTVSGNLTAPNVLYSITGTSQRISVTSGQNPIVDIASDYAGQNTITTLGTVTTGTWDATTIDPAHGGTGTVNGSITGTTALAFTAGGTNQNVTLSPSGSGYTILNGNVGIGTTNPQATLHISGSARFTDLSGTSNRCVYVDSNGTLHAKTEDCGTSTGGDNLGDHTMTQNLVTGNYWISNDGDDEGIRINASGYVGIGISSPRYNLHIAGTLGIDGTAYFAQNVGIGTTSPATLLDVNGIITATGGNSTSWNSAYTYRITSASGTSPLTLTLNSNVLTGSISDAAADGSTKGIAAFLTADFDSSSGIISLDYTNGQTATSSAKGFLSASDWTNFNTAYANRITSVSSPLSISSNAISISQATSSTAGYLSSADWTTFNSKQTAYANLATIGSLSNSNGYLYNNGSGTFSYSTPTGLISGLGNGYVPYATSATALANSRIYYDGTNVGIGTTNPVDTLHINGNAVLSLGSSIYSYSSLPLGRQGGLTLFDSDGDTTLYNKKANGRLLFNASTVDGGGSTKMSILGSGNIGIGTTAPGTKLDIVGGSVRTDNQLITTASTGTAPLVVSSTTLVANLNADLLDGHDSSYFQVATTNIVTGTGTANYLSKFTSAGVISNSLIYDNGTNIGIGTTGPSNLLEMSKSQNAETTIQISNANAGVSASAKLKLTSDGGDSYLYRTSIAYSNAAVQDDTVLLDNGGGDIVLYGASEIARFANGGNVGIGTTSPYSASKLHIASTGFTVLTVESPADSTSDPMIQLVDGTPTSGNDGWTMRLDQSVANILQWRYDNSAKMSLGVDGNLAIGAGVTSPGAKLFVSNTGSSDSFRVDDAASDGSPFIIDAAGNVAISNTLAPTVGSSSNNPVRFSVNGTSGTGTGDMGLINWSAGTAIPAGLRFAKSQAGTFNTHAIVTAGSDIGSLEFFGSDGTGFIPTAQILVESDGTPGTNDMPGRITFSTTADGASTVTEHMRITSGGNVGIGTTNPSQRLTVQSSGAGTDIFQINPSSGSAKFVLRESTSSDIFMRMYNASGSEVVRFDSSSGGYNFINNGNNVGIGTTSPDAKLHVISGSASSRIASFGWSSTIPRFTVENGGTDGFSGVLRLWNSTASTYSSQDSVNISSMGNSYFIGGNIGIGTTSPNEKLQVAGRIMATGTGYTTNPAGPIFGQYTSTIGFIQAPASGEFQVWTDASSAIARFMDSGNVAFTNNVGIGTTNPLTTLHVEGNIQVNNTIYGKQGVLKLAGYNVGSTTDSYISLYTANGSTTGERVRIDNSGNVGIGTTSPTYKLQIAGTLGVGSTAYFADYVGIGTTAPSAQFHTTGTVRFANFGAGSVSTDANGNLSVSSDERLKYISGAFTRSLSALMAIDPISYHWKKSSGLDTENPYTGFSAQNVQQSIPEAVGIDNRGYLTLSDRPILATAVNAIKELADTTNKFATSLTTLSTTTNQQQTQISGLASQTRDLSITANSLTTLTDQLTDENSSTTDKLLILAAKVEDLEKQLSAANSDSQSLEIDSTKIKSRLQDLEDQMALLKEENQAVIDFAKALDTQSLIYKDSAGNLDLTGGKITAQSIEALGIVKAKDIEATGTVAGASITSPSIETISVETSKIKGKTLELDSDTSGKAKIDPGDTGVTIETPEAAKNAKIYITSETALSGKTLYVDPDETKEGKSFTVKLDGGKDGDSAAKDIHFNWLIIK